MYRPALLLIAGLAACAAGTTATTPGPAPRDAVDELVGIEHPPQRAGIVERSSYLLDTTVQGRWVVAELIVGPERVRAVALERVITPGARDDVRYRTVAVQRIAPADSLHPVHLGTCTMAGRADRTVVAVGRPAATGAIRHAWRADTTRGAFIAIDASEVRCEDVTST